MILENDQLNEKEVSVILTIEIDKKLYYIYSVGNEFLHVGLKKKNKLVPLSLEEYDKIKDIISKFNMINSKVV